MGEFPSKEHQFKPGWAGGPGRPPGKTITERLRRMVMEDADGASAEKIANAAREAAEKGDIRFWNALMDRLEGPVMQRVQAEIQSSFSVTIEEARPPEALPEPEPDDDDEKPIIVG